jgi:hypothetical protein
MLMSGHASEHVSSLTILSNDLVEGDITKKLRSLQLTVAPLHDSPQSSGVRRRQGIRISFSRRVLILHLCNLPGHTSPHRRPVSPHSYV